VTLQHIPLLVLHVGGSIQPAILIAASGNRLRSAIPAQADVVEFKWEGGQWKTENGEPVEIQFDVPAEEFSRRALAAVRNQPAVGRRISPVSFQQARGCAAANVPPSGRSN
jgi:hypothetical protein